MPNIYNQNQKQARCVMAAILDTIVELQRTSKMN